MKLEPGSGMFHVIQLWNVSSPRDPHKPSWYLSMSGRVDTDEAWWSNVWWRDITVVQFITQDSTTAVNWQNPLHSHQQTQRTDMPRRTYVSDGFKHITHRQIERQTDRQTDSEWRGHSQRPMTTCLNSQWVHLSPPTITQHHTTHQLLVFIQALEKLTELTVNGSIKAVSAKSWWQWVRF